ncbi:integrase catalytic domain-containing protein [Trichonephila clavipes]|nr:integrase catalytic domain-containing protein [Trichonephila clavipes]
MDAANKAILERTKKTRSVSRSLVTKQINKLESEISNTADKTTVHEIYMQLISKFEELSTLDKEIENLINIESLEEEIVTHEEYRDKFIIWKIRAERYVESVSNTAIQNSVENQPQNITLPLNSTVSSILTNQPRLPKLTLESFSGKDISSFPSFWARFNSAVHENSSLNDVDKFSYLKSVVTSDAELAIRGLTLTSENYAKAMKILENWFGRKELIVDFHMNRLLNLTLVRKSFDVIALRNLYDQLEINIRGLESLEISPDSYSCLLFPIIMKAIPPDLALEYYKKHNETQSQITDLTAYLRSEVESRERTEFLVKPHDLELKNNNSYSNTKYFERTSHSYPQSNRRVQGHSRFHPSHKSFSSANELMTAAFSNCLFCSQNTHMYDLCSDFYWSLTHRIKRLNSSLVAVETSLGWSLQGKCDERSDCTLVHLVHSEEESISTELRRFWEIESLGILDKGSVTLGNGDEEILSEFDKSVNFVDGRYRVNLPWKPGMREALQNNKTVARWNTLDKTLRSFWETENLSEEQPIISDELSYCEKHFQKTHFRKPCGRYSVSLPFKENIQKNVDLGDFRSIASKRLDQLWRRLDRDPKLNNLYTKFIEEYLSLDHMEEITNIDDIASEGFFLPHHGVLRAGNHSRLLRVVFNGSQKTDLDISLNDVLSKGGVIQDDLFSMFRARKHAYFFSCDISHMFRQIDSSPSETFSKNSLDKRSERTCPNF